MHFVTVHTETLREMFLCIMHGNPETYNARNYAVCIMKEVLCALRKERLLH